MSLSISNPVNSISVEASRTHQTILTRAGSELTTGVKDNFSNIIDYVIGYNLSDNALLLRGIKSSSSYVTNMISQANDSLDSIHKKLIDIKQSIVKCKPVIDNSLLINRLNYTYRGKVQETIRFIDNIKFDNRNLFDGSLSNFKVNVGKGFNHTFEINVPQLLTSYSQLGINNEAPELQNNLVIIEDNIKRLNQEILTLKNRVNNKEKLEKQRELLILQKEVLELELSKEYNFDNTLYEQLEDLKSLHEQDLNDLKIKRNETEKQIQDLSKRKKVIESDLRSAKENYDNDINYLNRDKEDVLEGFAKNTRLLEEKIEREASNKKQIEQKLKKVKVEFEKNKNLIQTDLEIQEKSFLEQESDSSLLQNLKDQKDLLEKELKNLQSIVDKEKNNKKIKTELMQLDKKIANLKISDIDSYINKINGYKQQVPTLESDLEKNIQKLFLAEKSVNEALTSLANLEELEKDIDVSGSKQESIIELNKRKKNVDTLQENISSYKEALNKCQNAIKTGLTKIDQYKELMNKKYELTMLINSENTDNEIKINITQPKISEELVILNKKINELEQKLNVRIY
jgi:DNA repair exonuclease SbcCD ATPase subunit